MDHSTNFPHGFNAVHKKAGTIHRLPGRQTPDIACSPASMQSNSSGPGTLRRTSCPGTGHPSIPALTAPHQLQTCCNLLSPFTHHVHRLQACWKAPNTLDVHRSTRNGSPHHDAKRHKQALQTSSCQLNRPVGWLHKTCQKKDAAPLPLAASAGEIYVSRPSPTRKRLLIVAKVPLVAQASAAGDLPRHDLARPACFENSSRAQLNGQASCREPETLTAVRQSKQQQRFGNSSI